MRDDAEMLTAVHVLVLMESLGISVKAGIHSQQDV